MHPFQVKSARQSITNVAQARVFLRELIAILGFSFHPDTPVKDYVNETGRATFGEIEAMYIQTRINCLLNLYGSAEIMSEDVERVLKEFNAIECELIHGK